MENGYYSDTSESDMNEPIENYSDEYTDLTSLLGAISENNVDQFIMSLHELYGTNINIPGTHSYCINSSK